MKDIDVWLQHSIYCDYPVWRLNMLERNRDRFKKVVLYPSDHNREKSFKNWLFDNVKETWVKDHTVDWFAPEGVDWRQAEIEPMFAYSDAEWVYFTEQDWFVKDYNKFYDMVQAEMDKGADAIGFWNATAFPYLHPASFFIKREVLEKTQKDFRAHPEIDGCDHFAMLTRDLEKLGAKIVTYQDMGLVEWEDCFHLGGLTSNIIDSVANPETYRFHRPDMFYVYNWWSRQLPLPINKGYLDLSSKVEILLKEHHPEAVSDPKTSKWAEYFK